MRKRSMQPRDITRRCLSVLSALYLVSAAPQSAVAADAGKRLVNERFQVTLLETGALEIATTDGARRQFRPQFTILMTPDDPGLALRSCQIPRRRLGVNAYGHAAYGHLPYNVVTWGRKSQPAALEPEQHVEDGFDPAVDQAYGAGRTANVYHAAPRATVTAAAATIDQGTIQWSFDHHPDFQLSASVEIPNGTAPPLLRWEIVMQRDGYFSVGYTGAPQYDLAETEAIWQPMIWNARRFPEQPYLTQAFRCPLPTTLATSGGITVGVVADPVELPFMPMPTDQNSGFGVAVRNEEGKAQPAIFAPVAPAKAIGRFSTRTMLPRCYGLPSSPAIVFYATSHARPSSAVMPTFLATT